MAIVIALSPGLLQRMPLGNGSEPTVRVTTVNQLFASLRHPDCRGVLLDPNWVEAPWWNGILSACRMLDIPTWLVVETVQGVTFWRIQPEAAFPTSPPWPAPPLCVDKREETWYHLGQPLNLSSRQAALLQVFAGDPGQRVWSLDRINAALAAEGLTPISAAALKVHVHALRQALGPGHLRTVARFGYQWKSCQTP
ncbi:MAG: helix-turn-helix domain-containing protein [Firmicutes bacterium]|nr:helix-turn-helix domain-containing protein [Bacillota bacterium]